MPGFDSIIFQLWKSEKSQNQLKWFPSSFLMAITVDVANKPSLLIRYWLTVLLPLEFLDSEPSTQTSSMLIMCVFLVIKTEIKELQTRKVSAGMMLDAERKAKEF